MPSGNKLIAHVGIYFILVPTFSQMRICTKQFLARFISAPIRQLDKIIYMYANFKEQV